MHTNRTSGTRSASTMAGLLVTLLSSTVPAPRAATGGVHAIYTWGSTRRHVRRGRVIRAMITPVRYLYLLRHAKSSWDDAGLEDHDRPLSPRGRKAAGKMADHLRASGTRPALVLCSSALRARQTLERVAPAFGEVVSIKVERPLYGADEG